MKRAISILVLILVLLPIAATSQTHYKGQYSLGGHGGVDLSRIMFTPGVPQVFLPGMNLGVNFRYTEEKHFALIAEVNFMQVGWKENFDGEPFSYQRSVDYIQIPLMSQIYFGKRGKFFINLGPSISFKVGGDTKSNFDYENVTSIPDFPIHSYRQYSYPTKGSIDYGISGGLGGEFSINKKNSLYLEARYYFGLANILSADRGSYFRGSNPMSLQIILGYWFRIK